MISFEALNLSKKNSQNNKALRNRVATKHEIKATSANLASSRTEESVKLKLTRIHRSNFVSAALDYYFY